MSETRFSPHPVEWTPEKIRRFWDHAVVDMADLYFAKMVGHSLISYVSKNIPIGTALDLGCGDGSLIAHLLAAGSKAFGSDQSPDSVAAVNSRFSDIPGFKGAYVGTAAIPQVDTVFMVEVVEHMNDDALATAIAEVRKLLKPGGHVVLTTPNEENLAAAQRMCPDCGGVFHMVQHVRSWSAATLTAYMAAAGFRTVRCEPTLFSAHHGIKGAIDRVRYRRRHKPHLVYIGTPN